MHLVLLNFVRFFSLIQLKFQPSRWSKVSVSLVSFPPSFFLFLLIKYKRLHIGPQLEVSKGITKRLDYYTKNSAPKLKIQYFRCSNMWETYNLMFNYMPENRHIFMFLIEGKKQYFFQYTSRQTELWDMCLYSILCLKTSKQNTK